MNKYAISVLRLELSALKSHMRLVASTEFKMLYAGQIEEIKQAIGKLRKDELKCKWTDKNTIYETDCGNITNIDPDKFCPYCGKKICMKIIKHKD